MRNAILGAVVGLAAGWLLFRSPAGPPRAERAPSAPLPPAVGGARDEPPADEARPGPRRPMEMEARIDREWIRRADARALGRLASMARRGEEQRERPEITAEAVSEAIARIDEARSGRDWSLFVALVRFLGAAGTPEAQAKLVALVGDTTLLFHDWRIAGDFREALAEARADGVVAAVRARIEMEADHYDDKHRWSGWYGIVARHGSKADLEWLLAFEARKVGSEQGLAEALAAASTNPPAAESFMELWRGGRIRDEGAAIAFARNNPGAALPFFRDQFDRGAGDPSDVACAYGSAVTEGTLAEAKAFLLALRDPERRTMAAYAVTAMQRNKLDLAGLEPILLAPVEDAERLAGATREERERGFYRILYGIQYNRPVWSERAARALEDLAAAYGDRGRAEGLRDVAREIRAQIGSASADWVKSD